MKHFILAAALAMAVPLLPPLPAAAQQGVTMVGVDAVVRQPLNETFRVIGRLVARQRGVVAARTRGAVVEMRAAIGDRVAKGDVLATIDRNRLTWLRDLAAADVKQSRAAMANAEARFDMAEARVAAAEARYTLARQELARLEGLRSSTAFSQGRYDDLRQKAIVAASELDETRAEVAETVSGIDRADAGVLRAKATFRLAKDDLVHAKIRAPFDGVVILRHTSTGAFLEVGDGVVSLINDRDLEIEADVPFDRLPGLAPGLEVTLRLDDGSRHRATVRAVGVEENSKTRTRPVRFTPDFGDAGLNLADGQSASLDLPVGKARDIVSVHKDAVIRTQGQAVVFVVADGKVERRRVRLGKAVGERFEVRSGLVPGDLVVVRGNERLRPGQAVSFPGSS